MSRPATFTEPRSGFSSPTSVLRNTDLPVPDGPSITETSPAGNVNETSCQMTWWPKDLVSPSTQISTPIRFHPSPVEQLRHLLYGEDRGVRRGGERIFRERVYGAIRQLQQRRARRPPRGGDRQRSDRYGQGRGKRRDRRGD